MKVDERLFPLMREMGEIANKQVHRCENGVDSFLDGGQRRLEEEIK